MLQIEITGPAGSGKSYWSQKLRDQMEVDGRDVRILEMTGMPNERVEAAIEKALAESVDVVIIVRI